MKNINYIPAPGFIVVQAKINSDKPTALEEAGFKLDPKLIAEQEAQYIKDGNPLLVIATNIPKLVDGSDIYPELVPGVRVLVSGNTHIQQIEIDNVKYCTIRFHEVIGIVTDPEEIAV